jgi:rod shape-determining protein MreC
VLGLLVLCVLVFTSFFRESEGGFLHRFKGTVDAVFSPVQAASVAAVQPLKDGWNWFAELRTARDERNKLLVENAQLKAQIGSDAVATKQNDEFRQILRIANDGPAGYKPVNASVVARPADLSRRVELDKGRSDGVVVNSLVFAPPATGSGFGALAGIVTSATSTSSIVTFVTDPSMSIGARLLGAAQPLGLLRATPSGELLLDKVPASVKIVQNDTVVTAGTGTFTLPSPYPPGIRIGTVSSVGTARGEPGESQTVQVTPFVDPLQLSTFAVFVPVSPAAKRRAGA